MRVLAKNRISARLFQSTTPRLVYRIGLAFALLLIAAQAGYLSFARDEIARMVVNNILSAISSLAAVFGMAYGAWWSTRVDRRLGSAWRMLMLAMVAWAAGDLLWAYFEMVAGVEPYPSIADIFYLSTYVFFFIGILRLPRLPDISSSAAWLWLDVIIVMFSALGIYWNFLIGPTILAGQEPWLATLINSAYPVGDLLLVCAITLIIFLPRSPLWAKPLYLLLLGQGISAVVDGIYTYQTINETFTSGAFYNILFTSASLVLMLGGLLQAALATQVIRGQKTVPLPSRRGPVAVLRLIVPFLWLLVAYLLLNFGNASRQALTLDQYRLWVSAIIVILAFRHLMAALENDRLAGELRNMNDELETRVAERSADLLLANTELRRQMEERQRIEMMLREREEKLAHFALHDPLTGLPNRSLLIDRLTQAILHHRRHRNDHFAVLFLDFDSFKVVNDSLGHLAGDQLLIQIGQRLSSIVRAEDTVARLGGDEFVVLIVGFQDEDFVSVAAGRILDSLKEPFMLDARPIYITASIGVVLADPEYKTAIEIIRDADLAMYEAKSTGKARHVLFTPALRSSAINRLTLDSDLRQALETREFVLHYQPIVSLKDDTIAGFEALIRWQHPTRGLIGPVEFIPIAEASGFIDLITHWTIQEACRQLSEWRRDFVLDLPLFVTVNLSPHSLRQPELFKWVDEGLRAHALPPRCLTLEIVETALVQDADLTRRAFADLRHLGVEVSLDDFGIGYSSLNYINQYPIDILKIDRSFVNRVPESKELGAIVRAITTLAGELNIKVVAEGIETQAQLDFIKKTACQYAQGFFLAKPLDGESARALLEQRCAPSQEEHD